MGYLDRKFANIPKVSTHPTIEGVLRGQIKELTAELEGIKAQRTISAIERICAKCGHDTTEDGCAFCMSSAIKEVLGEMRAYCGEEEEDPESINGQMMRCLRGVILPCSTCRGTAIVDHLDPAGNHQTLLCPVCHGTNEGSGGPPCPKCDDTGEVPK